MCSWRLGTVLTATQGASKRFHFQERMVVFMSLFRIPGLWSGRNPRRGEEQTDSTGTMFMVVAWHGLAGKVLCLLRGYFAA